MRGKVRHGVVYQYLYIRRLFGRETVATSQLFSRLDLEHDRLPRCIHVKHRPYILHQCRASDCPEIKLVDCL